MKIIDIIFQKYISMNINKDLQYEVLAEDDTVSDHSALKAESD